MTSTHTYPPTNPPPYSDNPPPPQGQYPPQVTQVIYPGATIVQQPTLMPTIVVANAMGPNATSYVCKSCQQSIITNVERKPTFRTHMFALLLCLFGCWPCVCVPYCVDSCNNADHYCPNCNAYIGSYLG